jgi:hypothetical protein
VKKPGAAYLFSSNHKGVKRGVDELSAETDDVSRLIRFIITWHGLYVFVTGIWPVIFLQGFMAVTGPKTDTWLVRTMGAVFACIGVALFFSGREFYSPSIILSVSLSTVLTCIDIFYVYTGVIPKIYLADAAAEGLFLFLWIIFYFISHRRK